MANANEFFSSLGKTISKAASTVGKKTDEFVTIQKIRSRMNTLEEQVELSCRTMGEMIYQQYTEGGEIPEQMKKICRDIEIKKEEIAGCREQIALVKGGKLCPGCGSLIPKDANFCMNCGQAFPDQEGEEPESEKEE